jgi:hypothetical protein
VHGYTAVPAYYVHKCDMQIFRTSKRASYVTSNEADAMRKINGRRKKKHLREDLRLESIVLSV